MKTNDAAHHRIPKLILMISLCMMIMLVMLSQISGRAHAAEYTQLTRMTFQEIAELIDSAEYTVYYFDGEQYIETGYITGENNPNWYYIGAKDSVSADNNYYNGKSVNYYYSASGSAAGSQSLYSAPAAGAGQSFTVTAVNVPDGQELIATVLEPDGTTAVSLMLNSENNWTQKVKGLKDDVDYTVSVAPIEGYDTAVTKEIRTVEIPGGWTAKELGAVEDGHSYAFVYTVNGTSYALSGSGMSLTGEALSGNQPEGELSAAARWTVSTASAYHGTKNLQNGENYYLYGSGSGFSVTPSVYLFASAWTVDTDGSIWMDYNGYQQLYTENGTDFRCESDNFTPFTPYEYQEGSSSAETVYTVSLTESTTPKTLFVRLVGSFDSMITGQKSDIDAVSSATTGGASYYSGSAATAHVEYALADEGTRKEDVPEESWQKPDYFVNGGEMTVDGTKSRIVISPEDSGMEPSFNYFNGDLVLGGTAGTPGTYQVYAVLTDTAGRTDTSNALTFKIYTGSETLSEQLTLDNCIQTADGKYMFDQEPWYITDFGGDNTVTVPVDVKAWYGSHGALPTPNYGELGATISLTNGEQPFQTLVIPAGCNLTMVNMRVHSGVKIVVESGAKFAVRQTILEGIVEVHDGGSFSMDYNDFGEEAGWLSGSAINGQLRLLDGAVLDHARIVSHANYSARDDENRVNYDPIVTVDGNVTLIGDAYILGDEAPTGEAGQPGLLVRGTLQVPAGSTLAVYGGGSSFLTADGGDAILLDGGVISGDGNVIAVGGYGMNITADENKGHGGAAVNGSGSITVSRAWLEGGSSYQEPGDPTVGEVDVSKTAKIAMVKGTQGNETSPQYWHGTGDADGIVPDVERVLALIPEGSTGIKAEKTSVSVKVQWTDGAELHEKESVSVVVKDEAGEVIAEATVSAEDNWRKTVARNLIPEAKYTVETKPVTGCAVEIVEGRAKDAWDYTGQLGSAVEGVSYLISYEGEDGKTYILGAQDGVLGQGEWNGEGPEEVPAAFKWRPVFANSSYGWYLMNEGTENQYLSMSQSGWDYTPCMREKSSYDYYYALVIDEDGSIWSNQYSQNLLMDNGKLTASGSEYTVFTLHALLEKAEKTFTVNITPSVPEADFELPESLTTIEEEAFAGIAAECVQIPKNVTAIGKRAFADCAKLRAILIPSGVERIDDKALEGCENVVVYGSGTEAERFAKANGFPFVPMT